MKTNCVGLFGYLFGHKFFAQYDIKPPDSLNFHSGSPNAVIDVIDALSTRKYVCSVCRRCGEKAQS